MLEKATAATPVVRRSFGLAAAIVATVEIVAYEWPREALIVSALLAAALAVRFSRWWAQIKRR